MTGEQDSTRIPQGEITYAGMNRHRLRLENTAYELRDGGEFNWANVEAKKNPNRLIIKPVSGGEVTGDSYRVVASEFKCEDELRKLDIWPSGRRVVTTYDPEVDEYIVWVGDDDNIPKTKDEVKL